MRHVHDVLILGGGLEEGCRHRQLRLPCDVEADARDEVEGLAHLRLVRGDELLALLEVAHDLHEG